MELPKYRYGYLATVATLLAVAMFYLPAVQCRRLGEACDGSRAEWDKWFDGCQWCMCTRHGVQCSSSDCDGLVKKVAPCPLVGQRWSDGCYKCRCRRNGITCRLDATCHLLHHHPVPCLADERCICGPDGVPSCTAEVIDRRAFSAHRLDLRFPEVTYEFVRAQEGGHHKALKKVEKHADASTAGEEDLTGFQNSEKEDTSQELLIMSDNLCRLGSRWYGGSLRCFCDVDGAITCGDPAVVTAFIDNFSVQRLNCETGHAWEEGCSICTCRVDPVVFCQRTRDCRYGNLAASSTEVDFDHYLPVDVDDASSPPPPEPSTPSSTTSTSTTTSAATSRPPATSCTPGTHWREGCARCHCSDTGREITCSRRDCSDPHSSDERLNHRHHPNQDHDHQPQMKPHHTTHRRNDKDADYRREEVKQDNAVATAKPSVIPRRPMGPIMVPPPIPNSDIPIYYPPPNKEGQCGKFKVGDRFWKDCNLCFCTNKGPKCTAKNCR